MAVAVAYCRAPHTHISSPSSSLSLVAAAAAAAAVETWTAAAGAASTPNIIIWYSIIAVEHLDFLLYSQTRWHISLHEAAASSSIGLGARRETIKQSRLR